MSRRPAVVAAAVLITATFATVAELVLLHLAWSVRPDDISSSYPMELANDLTNIPMAALAALIVWRRPRNRFGWLLAAASLGPPIAGAADSYAAFAVRLHHGLPLGVFAAWLANWAWAPFFGSLPLLLLLFPEGRLPTKPRRVMAGLAALNLAALTAGTALARGRLSGLREIRNPTGWLSLGKVSANGAAGLGPLFALTTVLIVAAGITLLVRFVRATGDERLQIKWFAFACVPFAAYEVAGDIFKPSAEVSNAFGALLGTLLVSAVAIAVLRYRLYDIDRVVSRTVTYLVVTGLLVGAYVGCVAVTTSVLSFGSSLGVAASTLAAAALFQPVRKRVQAVVDQRFNRARYDAARTVERFAVRLRDEVHPEAVRADLLTVTADVLEPTHLTLWVMS